MGLSELRRFGRFGHAGPCSAPSRTRHRTRRDELDEPAVPGRLWPAAGVHAAAADGLHAADAAADADAGESGASPRSPRPPSRTDHARYAPQAQRTGFQPQMPIQVRLLSPAAVRARRGRGDPRPSAPTTPARPRPLTARPHALLMLRSRKLPASWACDSSLR